jgi:hypothetical protein
MSDTILTSRAGSEPIAPALRDSSRLRGRAAAALILAVDLGVMGDLLLRVDAIGVNITLWWWGLIAATVWLTRTGDVPLDRRRIALFAAAAVFSIMPMIRGAEEIVLLACVGVGTTLVLAAWVGGNPLVALSRSPVTAYLRAAMTTILHGVRGPFPLLAAEAQSIADLRARDAGRSAAVVRGLVIATPIVIVFALLLVDADPSFEGLVGGLFDWDADVVASHVALFAVFGWIAAVCLSGSLSRWDSAPLAPAKPVLGMIEAGVVLGAVDLLFVTFMLAQLRYLFGGAEHVLSTAGLTWAEYARRGFFELMTVSALSLPLLVGAFVAVEPRSPRQTWVRRLLSLGLIVLLMAMIGSALWRMHLYELMFGWTVPRMYATALMLWIAGTLLWFARTTLRDRADRFPFGPIVAGLGLIAAVGVANPASVVLTINAQRAAQGANFDGAHAAELGVDGIPTLVRILPAVAPSLEASERCAVSRALDRVRGDGARHGGWRGWNASVSAARRTVDANWAAIEQALGPDPCAGETATPG